MEFLHALLGTPVLYRLAMTALGSPRTRQVHVSRYIRPQSGDRILDVGCGVADIVESLPAVSYLGIDMNPLYIESARKRYGDKASFICKDVTEITANEFEPFDIILATGLLHHLSDTEAVTLLRSCSKLLKPAGRMVTFDGCRTAKQHPVDTWMLNNDRGKFVRTEEGYQNLVSSVFAGVTINVHSDLLRIPYTLAIMVLTPSSKQMMPECAEKVTSLAKEVKLASVERASES